MTELEKYINKNTDLKHFLKVLDIEQSVLIEHHIKKFAESIQPQTTVTDEVKICPFENKENIKEGVDKMAIYNDENVRTEREVLIHNFLVNAKLKLQPQEQKDSECCEPVKYNPFNKVVQCHKCGEIKEQKDSELIDEIYCFIDDHESNHDYSISTGSLKVFISNRQQNKEDV